MSKAFKYIMAESLRHDFLGFDSFRIAFNTGRQDLLDEIENRVERLKEKYGNEAYDFYSNEYESVDDTLLLFRELCVIAIYKDIENNIKKVMESVFEHTSKDNYKIKIMQDVFWQHGIVLTKMKGWCVIDEIREVNNCLKHSTFVSEALTKINGKRWKIHNRIVVDESDLDRYIIASREYKNDIYNNITEYIQNLSDDSSEINPL